MPAPCPEHGPELVIISNIFTAVCACIRGGDTHVNSILHASAAPYVHFWVWLAKYTCLNFKIISSTAVYTRVLNLVAKFSTKYLVLEYRTQKIGPHHGPHLMAHNRWSAPSQTEILNLVPILYSCLIQLYSSTVPLLIRPGRHPKNSIFENSGGRI